MENSRVPNNTTLAMLRRLNKALREIVGEKEAVHIELSIWSYLSGRIKERIGVYHSEGGPTEYFQTLKEAYEHLNELKKEKSNDNTSDSEST